jgi:hypothetical protein
MKRHTIDDRVHRVGKGILPLVKRLIPNEFWKRKRVGRCNAMANGRRKNEKRERLHDAKKDPLDTTLIWRP